MEAKCAIVACNSHMKVLIEQAKRFARFDVPVLLDGESGTGKELFAELIHASSRRANSPFLRVNCAALSEGLVESELFGHARGAFTDAREERQGRFELGEGGTILLDEVGEVPTSLQTKLLRLIENREYERVGSSQTRKHNVRIIAATNRDLAQSVREGSFRLDLLHRINVLQVSIPPLRERPDDIELLANAFIRQFNAENECAFAGLSAESIRKLNNHNWPGNVRELKNVIARACICSPGPIIQPEAIRMSDFEVATPESDETENLPSSWLAKNLEQIEKEVIIQNIKRLGSHRSAAEHLGISSRTLTNKMRKYRQSDRRAA